MVIRLDNQDISNAFVDYARKRLDVNLDGVASVEFRSARNPDGYCLVVFTNLLHIHPEMPITTINLNSFDSMGPIPQERKKTQIIPTAPLPPAPPFLFNKDKKT